MAVTKTPAMQLDERIRTKPELERQLRQVADGHMGARMFGDGPLSEWKSRSAMDNRSKLLTEYGRISRERGLQPRSVEQVVDTIVEAEMEEYSQKPGLWRNITAGQYGEKNFKSGLALNIIKNEGLVVELATALERDGVDPSELYAISKQRLKQQAQPKQERPATGETSKTSGVLSPVERQEFLRNMAVGGHFTLPRGSMVKGDETTPKQQEPYRFAGKINDGYGEDLIAGFSRKLTPEIGYTDRGYMASASYQFEGRTRHVFVDDKTLTPHNSVTGNLGERATNGTSTIFMEPIIGSETVETTHTEIKKGFLGRPREEVVRKQETRQFAVPANQIVDTESTEPLYAIRYSFVNQSPGEARGGATTLTILLPETQAKKLWEKMFPKGRETEGPGTTLITDLVGQKLADPRYTPFLREIQFSRTAENPQLVTQTEEGERKTLGPDKMFTPEGKKLLDPKQAIKQHTT